jgi:transposase
MPPFEERREAWRKGGVHITAAGQSAQLPAVKEVRPDYRDLHSQVLQDVLTRLDRSCQGFLRRVKNGEQPGYPRFQGATRYNSLHLPAVRHWGHPGQRLSGARQEWPPRGALVASTCGHADDGHDIA